MSKQKSLIALLVLLGVGLGVVLGGAFGPFRSETTAMAQAPQAQLASAIKPLAAPAGSANAAADDTTVINTVKQAEPAVVTIINLSQTQSQSQAPGQCGVVPSLAEGSGVIIDQQGH